MRSGASAPPSFLAADQGESDAGGVAEGPRRIRRRAPSGPTRGRRCHPARCPSERGASGGRPAHASHKNQNPDSDFSPSPCPFHPSGGSWTPPKGRSASIRTSSSPSLTSQGRGRWDLRPDDECATRGRSRHGSRRGCPWLRTQPSLGTLSLLRNCEFECKRRKGIVDILAGPGVHPLQTALNANNGRSSCGQIKGPLASFHLLDHRLHAGSLPGE